MTRTKKRIKTLWFDLGNVILDFDFEPAYRKLARYTLLDAAEIRKYFETQPCLEAALDEGRVNARSLYTRIRRDLGVKALSFAEFRKMWSDIFSENKSVSKLIRDLRRNGYRLILISNTNRLHYEYIARRYSVVRHFHHRILSYRLRARKPQPKIYHQAMRLSGGAKPAEIFYTDDRKDLTRAANARHGVHAHTFRSARALITVLKKYGVLGRKSGAR